MHVTFDEWYHHECQDINYPIARRALTGVYKIPVGGLVYKEPDVPINKINSFVSAADVTDPDLQSIMAKKGRVLNLNNVQAHEFGHGILLIQGYKPKTK